MLLALLLAARATLSDPASLSDDITGPHATAVLDNGARTVSAPLTADNCTGASQALSDGTAISWTRATSATCTKNDGTLTQVSSGQPRCNSSGCLTEQASTNVALQSEDFTNVAWGTSATGTGSIAVTANTGVALNGTMTADRIQLGAVATASQSVIFSGGAGFTATAAPWTFSCYIKGTSGSGSVPFQYTTDGFTTPTALTSISYNAATWTRGTITGTLTAALWRVMIGSNVGAAYATGANSAQDFQLWGCQIEAGSVATSYIPTTSAAVARNAENVNVIKPAWLTDSKGCAAATVLLSYAPTGDSYALSSGIGYGFGATSSNRGFIFAGVVTTATTTSFANRSVPLIETWTGSTQTIQADAVLGSGSYAGSMVSGGANIYLGSYNGGAAWINGYLSNVKLSSSPTGCK